MMWIALLGNGGVAVATYETVYYGDDEELCRNKAETASAEHPGQRVVLAKATEFLFTKTKVITEYL